MSTLGLILNPDAKYLKILRNEEVECSIHGVHKKWTTSKKYKTSRCNYCAAENQRKDRELNPIKYLLKDAKQHAKQRNRQFNLCEQDIINQLEKQNNKCSVSGLSFSEYKISLDRVDSLKGYTPDNIQLVTIQVNRMKSDFSQEDFIKICKTIAVFNEEKLDATQKR